MKYSTMEWGTMEAVVNKLGGMDGVQRFLRGELVISEPVCRWKKENGAIYFDVVFDGTSGQDWITRLEQGGKRVGNYAKSVLCSANFKPTCVGAAKIAVLPGELFTASNRTTRKIRNEADLRKFIKPGADLACVVCEMFTDKEIEEMGLTWIIAMHEPIADSDGALGLLGTRRGGGGGWLNACDGSPGCSWLRDNGFAFVSQVSS